MVAARVVVATVVLVWVATVVLVLVLASVYLSALRFRLPRCFVSPPLLLYLQFPPFGPSAGPPGPPPSSMASCANVADANRRVASRRSVSHSLVLQPVQSHPHPSTRVLSLSPSPSGPWVGVLTRRHTHTGRHTHPRLVGGTRGVPSSRGVVGTGEIDSPPPKG